MKLLKLYSDNAKFKEINFNPGLNIVAGLQSSKLAKDSYNGIGKSTSLNLLHLMFGGSFDTAVASDKKLQEFLSTYGNMYLDFKIGSVKYTIRKNFSENDFYLNDEKISKTAFPQKLSELIKSCKVLDMKFKPLFNMFARRYLPERNYYSGALTQQGRPANDFYQMMYNLRLLGIDTSLLKRSKKNAEEIRNLKKTEQLLNKQKATINETDLLDLEEERDRLLSDKSKFIIAKNYDELKQRADELTHLLSGLRNDLYVIEKDIRKKEKTLRASSDDAVDIARVSEIYEEAKFHFPEAVSVRIKDAEDFHIKIQKIRKERLRNQVSDLYDSGQHLKMEIADIETKRDRILKDLDSKGALEEYNSIVERIRTLESDIAVVNSYQTVLSQFEKDRARLDLEKAAIRADSVKYLEQNKLMLKQVQSQFRAFVKRFYRDHGGRLTINNAKDAQYLFNIDINIHKDGSQGVNEVKMFCYDLLLFVLNPKALGFLAHDSCIFSGVDPRQKATMFKVVLEIIREYDLQYFVNINKDTYEQVLSSNGAESSDDAVLTLEEKALIENSTVLELFDEKATQSLFGETFG